MSKTDYPPQINVYFVRHAESLGNVRRIHQGEDVSLSEAGQVQALNVSRRMKELNVSCLYSSPHQRTKQTAEIIAEGLKVPVEYLDDLKELKRPSALEGLSYDNPKAREIKSIIKQNQLIADWKYADDESYSDLLNRARRVVSYLLGRDECQNIVCVSHIQIIFMIVLYMIFRDKLTPKIFWEFYYHTKHHNTGITHMQYSAEQGWMLVTWNDRSHL